ncbi:hypothetical protein D3C72_1243280 [compost metagenome]
MLAHELPVRKELEVVAGAVLQVSHQRDLGLRRGHMAILLDQPLDGRLDRRDPDLVVVGRVADADDAHAHLLAAAQARAHHAFAFIEGEGVFDAARLAVGADHHDDPIGGAKAFFDESLVTEMNGLETPDDDGVLKLACVWHAHLGIPQKGRNQLAPGFRIAPVRRIDQVFLAPRGRRPMANGQILAGRIC